VLLLYNYVIVLKMIYSEKCYNNKTNG